MHNKNRHFHITMFTYYASQENFYMLIAVHDIHKIPSTQDKVIDFVSRLLMFKISSWLKLKLDNNYYYTV